MRAELEHYTGKVSKLQMKNTEKDAVKLESVRAHLPRCLLLRLLQPHVVLLFTEPH